MPKINPYSMKLPLSAEQAARLALEQPVSQEKCPRRKKQDANHFWMIPQFSTEGWLPSYCRCCGARRSFKSNSLQW